ncbi:hypothetical protein C1646_753643 [Rhizophagus diaphanus]|nr:hypothetical protein C1646_753643 [Rhizophagus diaphanus] [Rhizophagus sp. MUCL 43196]
MMNKQINSNDINLLNTNNLSHEFSQIIQNFNKLNIKEIKPTIENIKENTFLSNIIDELVDLIFKELNKGNDDEPIKQHIFDYFDNQKIILQEFYNWLLYNQDNSNSIFLFGYFNYYGIGTDFDKQMALKLYHKAAELENKVAQLNLANVHIYGLGIDKNYNLAFNLSEKLAEEEYAGVYLPPK